MTVQAMLDAKASAGNTSPVATARVSDRVTDAARELATRKIGAVVVTDTDGRVAGILSERDIVREVALSGPQVLEASVGSVMTRDVKTCTVDMTVDDVMTIMTRGRFRHLPVVDATRRLTGIVSIGDVVKFHVEEIEREASVLREYIVSH